MSQVSGVVQAIETKEVSGGRTAYSIRVAGDLYGAGLFAPKVSVGDYVTFNVEFNGNFKNVGRNSLKKSSHKPAPDEGPTLAPTAPAPSTSYAKSNDDRQETISRQAASNTAIALLQVLSDNDALGLPKSDAKGAKAKAVLAIMHKLEADFYERNTGKVYVDISPKAKAAEAEEAGEPVEEEAGDAGGWG